MKYFSKSCQRFYGFLWVSALTLSGITTQAWAANCNPSQEQQIRNLEAADQYCSKWEPTSSDPVCIERERSLELQRNLPCLIETSDAFAKCPRICVNNSEQKLIQTTCYSRKNGGRQYRILICSR